MIRSIILSGSQLWQHDANSHFLDSSRSSHSQLSMDRFGRCAQMLNWCRHTCLFFPALQRSSRCLMICVESAMAASSSLALTIALRVSGDTLDSKRLALYFSRAAGAMTSSIVESAMNKFHLVFHKLNESLSASRSKVGA